jgi:nucleoside-diphosphate-sugar epimerase
MRDTLQVLVAGAGGFIGHHPVCRLKRERFWVRGVDLKEPEFSRTAADEFILGDLRDMDVVRQVLRGIHTVYELAADMGGAGHIFTGEHDACVMHNSATINLNMLEMGRLAGIRKFFYFTSACIYPAYNQRDQMIRSALRIPLIPWNLIANTDGKSFSVNACILRTCAIMALRYASRGCITSLGRKARGAADARRRRLPFAVK